MERRFQPPPPTRYGPAATALPAKAPGPATRRAVPPPPVSWPKHAAVQAKPGQAKPVQAGPRAVPPPPVLPPRNTPQAGFATSSLQAKPATARPPTQAVGGGVIQRHIIYDFLSGGFISNGKRPGTHLSGPTMTAIIDDLIKNGARNEAEQLFVKKLNKVAKVHNLGNIWANPATAAGVVKSYNILSYYGFAVCHKVPYSAFEKLLLQCVQNLVARNLSTQDENALKDLLDKSIGNHDDWNRLKKWKDGYDIEHYARKLCDDFNANPNNLFIGFKSTNSSVSDNADLHWDSLAVGNATASPKGEELLDLTQNAELQVFGSQRTSSHIEVETTGEQWVLYSGVYGTKSTNTGYVQIN